MKYNCVNTPKQFDSEDSYIYTWLFFFDKSLKDEDNPIFQTKG